MVFNATFNNISVILWWSVLLVRVTGDNHWPLRSWSLTNFITYIMLCRVHLAWVGFKLTTCIWINKEINNFLMHILNNYIFNYSMIKTKIWLYLHVVLFFKWSKTMIVTRFMCTKITDGLLYVTVMI